MTGFVNVYKKEGVSSAYAVNIVKRLTGVPCGHMGTLDPLARGVLPVGVGRATRLFSYFLGKTKTYRARFRFGATTDTLDREGEVKKEGRIPAAEEVALAVAQLTGEYDQTPPAYSAKSVNGRRGYELARAGEAVSLPPKRVRVDRFRLLEQTAPDEYSFEIICGAGTYIRALARDAAKLMGTSGYMTDLERVRSGVFTAETAVDLEKLTKQNVTDYLIPTDSVLPFPVLQEADERLFHGVACACSQADGDYKIYREGSFYGIARVCGGIVKIECKLC